jgi:hypothetical protein
VRISIQFADDRIVGRAYLRVTTSRLTNPTTNNTRRTALSTLRAVIAAVLVIASFVALRELYRGECLWIRWHPGTTRYDLQTFFLSFFGLLFFACSIWFGAEVVSAVGALAKSPTNRVALAATGALLALFIYSGVGLMTWKLNPIPGNDDATWKGTRLYLSLFWPIGLLQETGNYRYSFCGQ